MSDYRCPKCGFDIGDKQIPECPKCGIIIAKYNRLRSQEAAARAEAPAAAGGVDGGGWTCACGIENDAARTVCSGCGWSRQKAEGYKIGAARPAEDAAKNTAQRAAETYCRNCGRTVSENAFACPACGVPPLTQRNFCNRCGVPTNPNQVLCVKCGCSLVAAGRQASGKSRMAAGLLGIFLGGFGAHKFYLNYTKQGVIMVVVSLVGIPITLGWATAIVGIFGLVEGIIYLTKSDADFDATYVRGVREWL